MKVRLRAHDPDVAAAIATALSQAGLGSDGSDDDPLVVHLAPGERFEPPIGPAIALGSPAQVAQALDAGAFEAAVWPATPEELAARVRAAVARADRERWHPWHERLFELVGDSVEYNDPSIRLRRVNPAFESVTGFAQADVIGRTAAELFRAGTHDESYYRDIGATIARDGLWRGAMVGRRHDGSLSFQQATLAEVRRDGAHVGFVALKRDASRDNLAQSAVAGATERLQTLVDEAADAVFVHGLDGQLVDVNRKACELLGAKRRELLGRSMTTIEAGPPEDLRARWARLEAGMPTTLESAFRTCDGREIPVELRMARTTLAGTAFVLVLASDITARKAAERALHEANEALRTLTGSLEAQVRERTRELDEAMGRLAAIVENVVDGLLGVGADGRVHTVNPALVGMLGLPKAGVVGALAEDVLDERLVGLVRGCTSAACVQSAELALGRDGVAVAIASPILDGGEVLGCVVLVRDVSREREIDRMKTDFTATVSHELRTPLTSVLGFAKLVRNKLDSQVAPNVTGPRAERAIEQIRHNLGIIVSEGERLTGLINDVLDISKMEAGRVDWSFEALSAGDLVQRAVAATAALFADGPELRTVIEPDLPAFDGDRPRLLQVLINLLSNAQKFTSEGNVTISARAVPEGVELAVTDTGEGIDPTQHEAIFEKFKQIGDTLTDKPRGTGLGLPICRQIVAAHGSRIRVDSRLGEGSRFSFVLAPRGATLPAPIDAHAVVQALLEQLRELEAVPAPKEADLLVVDDDPNLRELLHEALTERGYRVRTARDGLDAIRHVRQRAPDLIVLDVMMPDISGFDVAAMLKNDPATRAIPILVLSIVQDRERGTALGIDRILSKPVDEDVLVDAIRQLLRPDRGEAARTVLLVEDGLHEPAAIARALHLRGYDVLAGSSLDDAHRRALEARPHVVVVDAGLADPLVRQVRFEPTLAHTRFVLLGS